MVVDDLQRVIPEKMEQLRNRWVYAIQIAVLVVLSVLVVVLAVLVATRHSVFATKSGRASSCQSVTCLETAAWITENINPEVNPCDNFYQYACGGWASKHNIPSDQSEVTMIDLVENDIEEKLREIIEKGSRGKYEPTPAEMKLREFFVSCVHDYGRMKDGGRMLVQLIRDALGEWYVLNPTGWTAQWDFNGAIARVQGNLMVDFLFRAYLNEDSLGGSTYISIYPAGDTLTSPVYYLRQDKAGVQELYRDYMRKVASLLLRDADETPSPTEENARLEQFVADVYGHEERLAQILSDLRQQRAFYVRSTTTVSGLQTNFSQINWIQVLSRVFEDFIVTSDTVVSVQGPRFFEIINNMMINETNAQVRDRVFNNYIAWRIAYRYLRHLSWEYVYAGNRFREATYGISEQPPTWKSCINTVRYQLGSLLASIFIRTHLDQETKTQATDIFNNLRTTVAQRALELTWMDNITRTRANEKLLRIKPLVGFSEMYYNESLMEETHDMLLISKSDGYLKNLIYISKFQRRLHHRLFMTGLGRDAFALSPIYGGYMNYLVQPFYTSYYNTLLLPVGALLAPIFNTQRPQAFNYGIFGSVVAGEMFESISEAGQWSFVNLTYRNWWTNETSNEYKKTKNCFKSYFSDLRAGPFQINGNTTWVPLNGDIQAYKLMDDLGGIIAAYKTYQQWKQVNGEELMPVGLQNITSDQLYFISVAQPKCYKRTDEQAYRYANSFNSIPEDLQLNSMLSHSPEFTAAFQCGVGSMMRASYQCSTY